MFELLESDSEIQTAYALTRFSYPSPKFEFNPRRRVPNIDDLAARLDTTLRSIDEPRIVLVGHSQGGLVIQRYLALLLSEGRARELKRIRAVITFATPNNGSDFYLTLRRSVFYTNTQVRELGPLVEAVSTAQARILRGITQATSLSDVSCPIPMVAFAGDRDKIVVPSSARGLGSDTGMLPGDHASIIKPESRSDSSFVELRKRLLLALSEPIPAEPVVGYSKLAASKEQLELANLSSDPAVLLSFQGVPVRFQVHTGPVEKLAGIGAIVLSSNVYLAMSQYFKPSISGRLRRAGATKSPSGEILVDKVNDEITSWLRDHHRLGLPVEAGRVAATSAGALSARGIYQIYHAAIAQPLVGVDDYTVSPHSVHAAVAASMEQARLDAAANNDFPRSICFPLLGAGRGGLTARDSLSWVWQALETELKVDPSWDIHFITRSARDADLVNSHLKRLGAQL